MAETSRKSRPDELHRRRVLLLAESAGLVAMVGRLLGPTDQLSRLGSLSELAGSRSLEAADVVMLDLPDEDRAAAVGQVRRRYRGPLVVLAGEGEAPGGPLPDEDCTLLARPFSVEALAAALGVPGAVTAAAAALPSSARPLTVDPPASGAGRLGALVERVQRLLVALVEGWQTHRQVRVAGLAALALVAFTAAFGLAAQGRCGTGCDRLGIGLSPAPTIASVESRPPSSTRSRQPTSTTVIRAGTPGTAAFLGASRGRRAAATTATTSEQRAASTTRRPVTTLPATTRPATTGSTAPPTTAPPSTQPVTTPTTGSETPAPADPPPSA